MQDKILEAKNIIEQASSLSVLTGAGISSESGIPTFRGEEGLWKNYSPQELASPEAFRRDPSLVWEWYDWRRKIIHGATPNAGHTALSRLEEEKDRFTLITQNIDGLHQKAGNRNIIEIHGSIWELRCTNCSYTIKNYEVPLDPLPPVCDRCDAIMRPGTVWFGEIIPMSVIDKTILAIEESEVMLIVGTSGVVEPAASMGLMAKQSEKKVIEINLDQTPNSSIYDVSIQAKSGEVLPLFYRIDEIYN